MGVAEEHVFAWRHSEFLQRQPPKRFHEMRPISHRRRLKDVDRPLCFIRIVDDPTFLHFPIERKCQAIIALNDQWPF
jgi:hypothetical protein